MTWFTASCKAELLKMRRSKTFWITLLAAVFVPLMMGLLMYVSKDPDYARKMGLIGTKAQLVGKVDWQTYLNFLSQAISIGGMFLFGFVVSWIFGREYSDRTFKDLIALPVPRSTVVWSKFAATALWCILLMLLIILFGLLIGFCIAIPGWSPEIAAHGLLILLVSGILTILISFPAAFFASAGGGYMAPMAFVVLTIILAQVVGVLGWGAYFPWAVPALYTGAAGVINLGFASYAVLLLASAAGMAATLLWWRYADHK